MSSTRPYRKRLTPMQIDEIFQQGRGVQWDPEVVDALFACRMDLEPIRQKGLGESLQSAPWTSRWAAVDARPETRGPVFT